MHTTFAVFQYGFQWKCTTPLKNKLCNCTMICHLFFEHSFDLASERVSNIKDFTISPDRNFTHIRKGSGHKIIHPMADKKAVLRIPWARKNILIFSRDVGRRTFPVQENMGMQYHSIILLPSALTRCSTGQCNSLITSYIDTFTWEKAHVHLKCFAVLCVWNEQLWLSAW